MRFGAVPVGESGTTAGERDGSRYAREGTPLAAAWPGEAVVVDVRGIDAPRTSPGEL
ncbi:hypothetical protein SAMN05216275_108275 [Streptosporangium canum]|uniref:Uncharacterized protein n=1 Tax=Streptosporangium canum TaxID=324952 RepID=A0A1I3R6V6_9ACTN|nr:hypothetical protein [Streptosporangium canum]SFJ41151.1 hypothetical protein SAMN05216275_108275 [Streptosporangium canum]